MAESHPHHSLISDLRRLVLQARTEERPELLDLLASCEREPSELALHRAREAINRSIAQVKRRRESAPVPRFDDALPISARRDEIAACIRDHQVCVICGETGSGKTTQLPKICLSIGRGAAGLIGHTQPRRVAARSVAQRIADELGSPLGGYVGVQVRFQDQTSDATVVKLLTDGLLLAHIQSDPTLSAFDTIIIDEAHERSLNIDFLLGYLKTLLPRRPDLKVIITSATIDPQRLSTHFGGPEVAPVIEVSGRMYPVTMKYRPIGRIDDPDRDVSLAIVDAVRDLTSPRLPKGDVLVFLPGEREIRLAADALRRDDVDAEILPLYARLSAPEQDRVFSPSSRQRVVLATNVAETSLTIPGIRYVVDPGLARISRYDHLAKVQRLNIEPISRASADQRAGRCGRVAEGICIRLFSEDHYRDRPRFTDPEILRTSLASVLLQLKSLDLGPVGSFPFIEPPGSDAIQEGAATLFDLGAIASNDADAELTDVGRQLAGLPVDPKLGRILIAGAALNCLEDIIPLAAALSIQDPRERPMERSQQADAAHSLFRQESSDFMTLLRIWDESHEMEVDGNSAFRSWCREHFVSFARMREWRDIARQLHQLCDDLGLRRSAGHRDPAAIHKALLTGLIANVLCRDESGAHSEYSGSRSIKASIFPGSVLFKKTPKWIVAAEIVQTSRVYARTAASIEPEWIADVAPHTLRRELTDPGFDRESLSPVIFERVTFNGLALVPRRRVALAPIDPLRAHQLFVLSALAQGLYEGPHHFAAHNRELFARADELTHKLRRRNVIRDAQAIAARFREILPTTVHSRDTLDAWVKDAARDTRLRLSDSDVLDPQALSRLKDFPDEISPGHDSPACPVSYSWSPGKPDDGITLSIPLIQLGEADPLALEWLVPGMLAEKILALLKTLPKSAREAIESATPLADGAQDAAELLPFRRGSLRDGLANLLRDLYGVTEVEFPANEKAIADHLRVRVVVLDDHEKPVGEDRDIPALLERLSGRLSRAQAGAARRNFERAGITSWNFGSLAASTDPSAYPMLVDERESVRLTLAPSGRAAASHTWFGIRRLFALAAKDEIAARITSHASWPEMSGYFKALGSSAELQDAIICLACEATFLTNQSLPATRDEFEQRQLAQWGRLGQVTTEVALTLRRTLEARSKVAHRLAGGTPRLWANSIADIREHAAYLMPRGFLHLTPWERLRHYARFTESMRERLFRLREDGSGVETVALTTFAPQWKRFTGWVARAMADQRQQATDAGEQARPASVKSKAPLPQTRRTAPAVNVDAGEWILQPGRLPAPLEAYRWALEEARIGLFVPESGAKFDASLLESMWKKVEITTPG